MSPMLSMSKRERSLGIPPTTPESGSATRSTSQGTEVASGAHCCSSNKESNSFGSSVDRWLGESIGR